MTGHHKRYNIMYESDKYNPFIWNPVTMDRGSYDHNGGNASTIKSAQSVIRNIRVQYADEHPRNFRIFDVDADVDPITNHVPCVMQIPV